MCLPWLLGFPSSLKYPFYTNNYTKFPLNFPVLFYVCMCVFVGLFMVLGIDPSLTHARQALYHLSHILGPYVFIYLTVNP
jgi:hypothetical protein